MKEFTVWCLRHKMEYFFVRGAINRRNSARQRQTTLALHRSIRDMTDPFNDPNFKSLYRLTPDLAKSIIEEIRAFYPDSIYTSAIAVEIKFLAALHFYAQGSYQRPDGRDCVVSLSQASVCRFVKQTTEALNRPEILAKYVRFPHSPEEKQATVEKNFRKYRLPGVLGFVDGTHILIKKPHEHEESFVNRKGTHSLNVQVVCDSDLPILNVLARYPGSTHDAFVWKASAIREVMQLTRGCWLLGDTGYPLEPWLFTPILNAIEGSLEEKYTQMHILARNSIERCFGVWKNRFRCLNKNRVMEYSPTKAGLIVNACAVLHNLCIKGGVQEQEDDLDVQHVLDQEDQRGQLIVNQEDDLYERGLILRAGLINRL